jgi:PST family polysaccharide transporter
MAWSVGEESGAGGAAGVWGREVATSSAILLTEAVTRVVTVVVLSFWIARQLGPAQFGILNFASTLLALMIGFAEMGLDVPVILRLTGAGNRGVLMGTVLAIRAASGGLVFLGAVLLAFGLKHDDPPALIPTLIVSLGILVAIPNVFDYWFKARTAAGPPALVRTAATMLAAAAKGACLLLGLGVVALAWTVVLEAALVGLGFWCAFRWSAVGADHAVLSVKRSLARTLVRQSGPYLFSSVAVLMYMKVDVVLLGYLSTNTQTGIYALAQKISEVLYIVPVVLIASAFPSLARRFQGGLDRIGGSQQLFFDLAVGSSLVVLVAANVLAQPMIEGLFGTAYRPAIQIFHLHSWSCIAIAMYEARHRWMATASLQRYSPLVTSLGLALNIAMNLVLIPRLGAQGAAISTVASYFVSGYLSSFLLKPLREAAILQTRALWPWPRLYRAALLWRAGPAA